MKDCFKIEKNLINLQYKNSWKSRIIFRVFPTSFFYLKKRKSKINDDL